MNQKNAIHLTTLYKKKKFSYTGNVSTGTTITYGKGHTVDVNANVYKGLVGRFRGQTVDIGASRTKPMPGSIGEWLQNTAKIKTAVASYVAPILVNAGLATIVKQKNVIKIKF